MTLGAIEAGGTKIICATGNLQGEITQRSRIDTLTPQQSIPQVLAFFDEHKVDAIGIGTFGPADCNENSETYGRITTTPKPGWRDYNLRSAIADHLKVPVAFDTDVNAAVYGEYLWGAAQGLSSAVYVTVGTGVGAGAIVGGTILKGLSHPEMGHMLVRRHPDDHYEGFCPFHKDCVEGMIAGPAIAARAAKAGDEIADSDPLWNYFSYYLAQMLYSIALVVMPERFIIGGGVMARAHLFSSIRAKFLELSAGYMQFDRVLRQTDSYIVAPALGGDAGIKGALGLAIRMLQKTR